MSEPKLNLRMSPKDIVIALKSYGRVVEAGGQLDPATAPTLLTAASEMIARLHKDVEDLKRDMLREDDVSKIAGNVIMTRLGKTDRLREMLDGLQVGERDDKVLHRLAQLLTDIVTRLPVAPSVPPSGLDAPDAPTAFDL